MKILWEEEGFQFGFKRWKGWAVSKYDVKIKLRETAFGSAVNVCLSGFDTCFTLSGLYIHIYVFVCVCLCVYCVCVCVFQWTYLITISAGLASVSVGLTSFHGWSTGGLVRHWSNRSVRGVLGTLQSPISCTNWPHQLATLSPWLAPTLPFGFCGARGRWRQSPRRTLYESCTKWGDSSSKTRLCGKIECRSCGRPERERKLRN